MKFRIKLFLIISVFVFSIGLNTGLNDDGSAEPLKIANRTDAGLRVSELMRSMKIYKLGKPVEAPDFSLLSIEDNRTQLSKYRGKIVLLSFWTTW